MNQVKYIIAWHISFSLHYGVGLLLWPSTVSKKQFLLDLCFHYVLGAGPWPPKFSNSKKLSLKFFQIFFQKIYNWLLPIFSNIRFLPLNLLKIFKINMVSPPNSSFIYLFIYLFIFYIYMTLLNWFHFILGIILVFIHKILVPPMMIILSYFRVFGSHACIVLSVFSLKLNASSRLH